MRQRLPAERDVCNGLREGDIGVLIQDSVELNGLFGSRNYFVFQEVF